MKLAYWITPALKTLETKVTNILDLADGRKAILLESTIFYAQGGGQPADRGVIRAESKDHPAKAGGTGRSEINSEFAIRNSEFVVVDVRRVDDDVYHYGHFVGEPFKIGDTVSLIIDWERRWLNTRLHSAAHLLDAVMRQHYPDCKPIKSYHFPEGPYVEYQCTQQLDTEQMKDVLLNAVQEYLKTSVPISTDISNPGRRVVTIESSNPHPIPCGGTHVNSTQEIGSLEIRKIKIKNGICRISYSLI